MGDGYFESSSSIASQPLPTPADTPYQTPFLSASRRSSGRSFTAITPPPLPSGDFGAFKENNHVHGGPGHNNQDLTPSLHASLVSEILSLRRDVESKDNFIDRLESIIADERAGNEHLHEDLKRNTRETKNLKKQLQSIETSTLTALEDLCKERDQANAAVADYRKKHDSAQKQLKSEQEHIDALHRQWEQEKAKWEQERRNLLRKNELAETRLQAVLEEVTAAHTTSQPEPPASPEVDEVAPLQEDLSSIHSSPTKVRKHRRNQSSLSTLASVQSNRNTAVNGLSLEDELNGDDSEEDDVSDEDVSDHETRLISARESRSSAPGLQDAKARKILGLASGTSEETSLANGSIDTRKDETDDETVPQLAAAVSFVKPKLREASEPLDDQSQQFYDVEANQRRKRDPLIRWAHAQIHARAQSEPVPAIVRRTSREDASRAANISPPGSPRSFKSFVTVDSNLPETVERPEMVSSATQTDQLDTSAVSASVAAPLLVPAPPARAPPPVPIGVPSIAIHPPAEGDASFPTEAVLPPGTKNVACQTDSVTAAAATRSSGTQTDVIRVDRRPFKLPPHLLPSALLKDSESKPSSSLLGLGKETNDDTSTLRSLSPSPSPTEIFFARAPEFLNNRTDSSPLDSAEGNWARLRKTLLQSNRQIKVQETDPFTSNEDVSLSDGDYIGHMPTMRAGKRPQRGGRPSFDPPTPVPEDEKVIGGRSSLERPRLGSKSHSFTIASKGKHVRRPSNNASQRSASPSSFASSSAWSKMTGPNPPIAIPQRTSSVGIRQYRTSGASSPTRGSGASSPTKRYDVTRVGKKHILRKVRSSGATPSDVYTGSLPMSPLSRDSFASAELSPLPVQAGSALVSIQSGHVRSSSSQARRLSSFLPTGNASVGQNIQHTVVDAIAQTMVGEWMWKYVRKRKSFGLTDSSAESSKTGDARHKRWVWLSPYERTVMWSTKQPTSNAALLGKNGRTRTYTTTILFTCTNALAVTIQSVLDVKDDNVSTKAPRNVFNRSILVLTPTRALKFTAITRERHYLWLTALSFLAHHTSHGSLDLSFLPLPRNFDQPPNEADSRNTSGTVSRSSRKPWSSRTRSRHSSGYATPSIPEASESVEGSSLVIPPRPNRPAPALPQEHYFPDTALAPNIPRVPGGSSGSRFNLHGRKRSASITGIMTTRSSTKLNHSGTSSLRSVPIATTAISSNQSSRSGFMSSSSNVARPPLPLGIPNLGAVSSKQLTPSQLPSTPILDDDPNRVNANGNLDHFSLSAGNVPGLNGGLLPNQSEFGGNNSFFDAAGRKRPANGVNGNGSAGMNFDGPGIAGSSTRDLTMPMPATIPVPLPVSADDAEALAIQHQQQQARNQYQHQNNMSVDSVAPPPIQRRSMGPNPLRESRTDAPDSVNQASSRNENVAAAVAAANAAAAMHAQEGKPRRKWF